MKITVLICSLAMAGFALSLQAQTNANPPVSASTPQEMATAEVRRVDKEAKKVTLKHGPIKSLDMPPRTMVFQVRDERLFDKLVAGEQIRFSAEQLQGAFVLTSVERQDSPK